MCDIEEYIAFKHVTTSLRLGTNVSEYYISKLSAKDFSDLEEEIEKALYDGKIVFDMARHYGRKRY